MMYARVEQGVVQELLTTDRRIEDLYHPDLLWVDVESMSGIQTGWVVSKGGFSPPVPEMVAVATPIMDVAELTRRVSELQEQIRILASDMSVPPIERG